MNWNGYNPARYTPGAYRELVRSLGPFQTSAGAPQQRGPLPPPAPSALPSWLPACDE